MTQNFAPTTTLRRFQNPGYEYLLGIHWMKEAQVMLSSEQTRYYLPAKAILRACLAIDSYVNVVGSKVDPLSEHIYEETTPIKERMARIYTSLKRSFELDRNMWEDVFLLFSMRQELSRFELASIYGMQESVVPAIFKVIEQKYPIRLTHSIAEGAIELLLNITD